MQERQSEQEADRRSGEGGGKQRFGGRGRGGGRRGGDKETES